MFTSTKRKLNFITITSLLLMSLLVCASIKIQAAPLAGIAYLVGADQAVKQTALTNPSVGSIVLRTHWKTVEPVQGQYNWAYYDATLPKVTVAKPFSFGIAYGGDAVPPWIFATGVKPFSFVDRDGAIATVPMYTDDIFLAKRIELIKAFGIHYANQSPASVYAGCANSDSADWFIPGSATDVKNLLALGYTTQKMIDNCVKLVEATLAAFPRSQVRLPVGPTPQALDKSHNTTYVADQVLGIIETKYPGRLIALKASASANTPLATASNTGSWSTLKNSPAQRGFQALWMASDTTSCRMNGGVAPCKAGDMLTKTFTAVNSYNISYGEIYAADWDSADPLVKAELDKEAFWLK